MDIKANIDRIRGVHSIRPKPNKPKPISPKPNREFARTIIISCGLKFDHCCYAKIVLRESKLNGTIDSWIIYFSGCSS